MDSEPDNKLKQSLYTVITRILTPLVSVLLRNGITFHVFSELAKQAYVRVASKEQLIPGKKQTITRIATITGLPRKEVGQIKENTGKYKQKLYSMQRHNRAARVISSWTREPAFHNKRGKPASLAIDKEENSFSKLVRASGVDIPPRAILDELIRSGTVGRLKNGRVALLVDAYVPAGDDLEKMAMLGTDVRDLIRTIDHNLTCEPQDTFFQRKTIYDDIPAERLEKLRAKLRKIAQSALEEFDRELASADRDANPKVTGTGRHLVGMNLYYFEEKYNKPDKSDEE